MTSSVSSVDTYHVRVSLRAGVCQTWQLRDLLSAVFWHCYHRSLSHMCSAQSTVFSFVTADESVSIATRQKLEARTSNQSVCLLYWKFRNVEESQVTGGKKTAASWNVYTQQPPGGSVESHTASPLGWLETGPAVFTARHFPRSWDQSPTSFRDVLTVIIRRFMCRSGPDQHVFGAPARPTHLIAQTVYGLFVYTFLWLALFLSL